MDIISHGLWGGLAFGRKSRRSFWLSFFFGIAPDLLSFGLFTMSVWLGLAHGLDWNAGPPDPGLVPQYVHNLYNVTHSLVVFALAFGLVWLLRKKPVWEMGGWLFHILLDIPTHGVQFFPTPFLWPISDVHIDGRPWSNPDIFIPNVVLLISLYLWFFVIRRRRMMKESATAEL